MRMLLGGKMLKKIIYFVWVFLCPMVMSQDSKEYTLGANEEVTLGVYQQPETYDDFLNRAYQSDIKVVFLRLRNSNSYTKVNRSQHITEIDLTNHEKLSKGIDIILDQALMSDKKNPLHIMMPNDPSFYSNFPNFVETLMDAAKAYDGDANIKELNLKASIKLCFFNGSRFTDYPKYIQKINAKIFSYIKVNSTKGEVSDHKKDTRPSSGHFEVIETSDNYIHAQRSNLDLKLWLVSSKENPDWAELIPGNNPLIVPEAYRANNLQHLYETYSPLKTLVAHNRIVNVDVKIESDQSDPAQARVILKNHLTNAIVEQAKKSKNRKVYVSIPATSSLVLESKKYISDAIYIVAIQAAELAASKLGEDISVELFSFQKGHNSKRFPHVRKKFENNKLKFFVTDIELRKKVEEGEDDPKQGKSAGKETAVIHSSQNRKVENVTSIVNSGTSTSFDVHEIFDEIIESFKKQGLEQAFNAKLSELKREDFQATKYDVIVKSLAAKPSNILGFTTREKAYFILGDMSEFLKLNYQEKIQFLDHRLMGLSTAKALEIVKK